MPYNRKSATTHQKTSNLEVHFSRFPPVSLQIVPKDIAGWFKMEFVFFSDLYLYGLT